ncbi:hypothetical protein EHQ23_16965 [Leptospira bourretii]|uniref:Uncharacterized protein n=1 Tax=Leptospira bourretii TaxID=2484962 RepID=A0A4R9IJF1_9LEPT|nr:hypothetical protein [Leptospira bourretii]TGK79301.1 hypothetical protein EHQ23_16965 [Leptospira bourretii]TGK89507.1 hypothetical protein EHQ26_13815 [Leptospira bourretii]TGL29242.1 hypothetical protein EHQ45_15025 [Leptospira bourretii]
MDTTWKKLQEKSKIKNPIEIVEDIFQPLEEASSKLVKYEIQKVNFFPEEVTYTQENLSNSISLMLRSTKNPHPEFGYDPQSNLTKEFVRFRLLLIPMKNKNVTFELFKVKFPILFYPLNIYCDVHTFPEIKTEFVDGKLLANSEADYIKKIGLILNSETTVNIIQRLMSF